MGCGKCTSLIRQAVITPYPNYRFTYACAVCPETIYFHEMFNLADHCIDQHLDGDPESRTDQFRIWRYNLGRTTYGRHHLMLAFLRSNSYNPVFQ